MTSIRILFPDQGESIFIPIAMDPLTIPAAAIRDQAVAHNIEAFSGQGTGLSALTVGWAMAPTSPGQQQMRRLWDRYLGSCRQSRCRGSDDWRMFIEHKLYEPAFYSTVVSD